MNPLIKIAAPLKFGAFRASLCAVLLTFITSAPAHAQGGFAGTVTGGAGGPTVTVTTLSALTTAIGDDVARVVNVSGVINLGSANVRFGSNKTIQGVGTNSGFIGNLKGVEESNVIIQRLSFTNPSGVGDADGLSLEGCTRIWVDHCSFVDCGDGSLDIKRAADLITVSWCKFSYTFDSGHNFVNLLGHSDGNAAQDTGKLRITMHHNWYSTLCKERMPRVRFGQVHVYNNYYSAAGSNYNIGVGNNSRILVENCYFENQPAPWANYSSSGNQGLIRWNTGNVFVNSPIPTWAPNSTVFTPPYSYTLESGSTVKASVMAGAGSGGSGGGGNAAPTVSLTSPANGATFTAGSNIAIAANAADSDGTVSRVEFFQGSTLLGTDTTSPYSFTWNGVAAGSYSLTARATDNQGATTTSAARSITVGSGSSPVVVQSETGTRDSAGVVETEHAGWSGTGYVNTGNAVGAFSEVTVNVPTARSYTITFRHANGTTTNRPADLRINGVVAQTAVAFNGTGAWSTWADVTVTRNLNAGNNTIRLTATTANGCSNLDRVTVQ